MRILFAHPNEKISGIYHRYLSDHFEVDLAADGLLAMRKIKLHKPWLIVSDYNLPRISGIALLKFVRGESHHAATPFIFLTDHPDNSQALSEGAHDWLALRSCGPEELLDRIYYHLKLNRNLIKMGAFYGV